VRIECPSFAGALRISFDQFLVTDREMLLSVSVKHTKAYKSIQKHTRYIEKQGLCVTVLSFGFLIGIMQCGGSLSKRCA